MAAYFFNVVDHDGLVRAEQSFEFRDLDAAIEQARTVLAEMALDGLPTNEHHPLAIDVQDAARVPIARLILEFRIQFLR